MPLTLTSGFSAAAAKNIRKLFGEAKAMYAPGGEYMAGTKAQLARGRKRAMAGGMQALAGAGLAGTSMAGGLAKRYEEEVGAPMMAQATTQRLSALSGLLAQEAGAEMQMAPRYAYQPPQQRMPSMRGAPGAPSVSAPQRMAAQPRQQPAQQQPTPSPPVYAMHPAEQARGGQAVYFGAAYKPPQTFYEAFQATAPKPAAPAPSPTSLSSIYAGTYY